MTTVETQRTTSPLHALPPLLRSHPALADVLGRSNATLAASASVQPFVVAALAHFSELAPIVVVTPTVADAERLVDDLRCFLLDAQDPAGSRLDRAVRAVGDAPARAGQPGCPHHGSPAVGALASLR